ncbi:MAG: NAD(P)H-binding protein [Steroidobacteraceae bacterium]
MNRTRRRLLVVATVAALFGGGQPARAASPADPAGGQKLVIAGASGQLGELTARALLQRGVPARNLILVSRTPEKLAGFAALGAATRFGDVDHPESLAAAFAGGDRLLLVSLGFSSPDAGPRPERHKRAFDAAVKAGVHHIVYTSYLGVGRSQDWLATDHGQSEAYLRASGAKWTALRNAFYADTLLDDALRMAATGRASARPGDPPQAPLTRADCAAAAAGALLGGDRFDDQALDITGTAAVTVHDVARIVGEITGRSVAVVEDAPASGPGGFAPPSAVVSDAVQRLTGHAPTSVRALIEAHRAELVAAAQRGSPP